MQLNNFTYDFIDELIKVIKENDYKITGYDNYHNVKKPIIIRHDIDFSLEKALQMAKFENQLGISANYFIMLTGDFYNIFSYTNTEIIKEISRLGHKIGLHFDEKKYSDSLLPYELEKHIHYESKILSELINEEINIVSMHRPSYLMIRNNYQIANMINSYSEEFFHEFKYISDSRMCWKEDVINLISNNKYPKIHILIHPFWYSIKNETTHQKIHNFIYGARVDRYNKLSSNLSNLDEFIKKEDII